MSVAKPEPLPEVLSLVRACGPLINETHAHEIARAFSGSPTDPPPAEPTEEQLESVYTTARHLCDQGNFRFAAALALHLFTHKPGEPRYAFIAGTCMQRIHLHASAAKFFCYALVNGGDNSAALYRLGECLLALHDNENAEKAFEAALDVARTDADTQVIAMQAEQLVELARCRRQ